MKQVNAGLDIYRSLSELARRYQFRSRDEVCCYGLTVSQCYALEMLYEQEKLTSSELSSRLGLDLSSTTRVVDELVRKKLAQRDRSADDGRVREIVITEAGQRMVSRIMSDLIQVIDTAMAPYPEAARKALPGMLHSLATALECCVKPQETIIPVERLKRELR
jgi:DNA-binding MarR family transcriptional regulator